MYINEETAQLILDAIAWSNDEWIKASEETWTNSQKVAVARVDFVNFCHARGIIGVERKINVKTPVERVEI